MSAIRYVIFDLDGTLVDSLPGIQWSLDAALAACGTPARTFDLKSLIGPPVRDILVALTGISAPAQLDRLESAFRASYDSTGWLLTHCHQGIRSTLERLIERGIGLFVVTNKPAGASLRILRKFALEGLFTEVLCRDSRSPVFGTKCEMLRDVMHRHSLNTKECLMVGDTLEDCRAADEVGLACLVVPHGYGVPPKEHLPPRCRTITGWHELEYLCSASAPFPLMLLNEKSPARQEAYDRS